jgi:hypothetical protein
VEFVGGVTLGVGVVVARLDAVGLPRLEVLEMLDGVSTTFVGRGVDATVLAIVKTMVIVEPAAVMVACEAPMQEHAEE